MKKTLYEILGIPSTASKEEIEAAYIARIDELKFATLQDPNKLRVLQQSREVLADANRRATYDASLATPEPAARQLVSEVEPAAPQKWGVWIALAALAIAVAWWLLHGSATAPPVVAKPAPVKKAAPVAQPKVEQVVVQTPVTPAVAPVVSATDAAAEPVIGDWSCTDAISGHSSKYAFREGGTLTVTSNEGVAEYKFELAGHTLTLTDTGKVTSFTAEELVQRKMILNAGGAGHRIVCKR